MKKICLCFECCEDKEATLFKVDRTVVFKETELTFKAEEYICDTCHHVVSDDELYNKNVASTIRAYKEQKKLLSSEKIRYIREDLYNLTVRNLAKLIGCSPATISKYENGSIQTGQHDFMYRMLEDPENMAMLIKKNGNLLEKSDLIKLNERLDFLLEALRIKDVLTTLNPEFDLPEIDNTHSVSTISYETLEEYFIIRGYEDAEDEYDTLISNKKLQKMSYFTQGWHYALTGEPIIINDFEAWRHGPVIRASYHKYKYLRYAPIPNINKSRAELELAPFQVKLLDWIWDKYHHFDAQYLELLSHKEKPWISTRGTLMPIESCTETISKEKIRDYYTSVYKALKILDQASIKP